MASTANNVKGERFAFNADIQKLMGIIINAVYTYKGIFLRELCSNSSDAINKARFLDLQESSNQTGKSDFKIEIKANEEAKTLTIRDNGIGMTKKELIENLGTIANSGTKGFMDALKAGADIQMIGQFGVGFYSAFLIANKVRVRSKHNDDKQHVWESCAGGQFDVYDDSENEYQLKRGTEITLYVKDDQTKFLEERELLELIKKHSQFIEHPINLWITKEVKKQVPIPEEEKKNEKIEVLDAENDDDKKADDEKTKLLNAEDKKADDEKTEAPDAEDKKADDEKTKLLDHKEKDDKKEEEKPKTKEVTEMVSEWKQINKSLSLWNRKPDEIKKEEYHEFYKSLSGDWENPLEHIHFHVEGEIEFTGILFIPKRPPFDMFSNKKSVNNIKLYVRRVYVNEESKKFCPEYLSFVKGVIDSEDMPLNISRETLQENKITKMVRKHVTKKCIELMEKLAEKREDFLPFYKSYSKNLKLGVHEDHVNRIRLVKLLLFKTSKSGKDLKTIPEYIQGMKKGQKTIYYITGEAKDSLKDLPFLEKVLKKDFEVLYMTDPIDEYVVQQVREVDGMDLVSITKEGLELDETDEEKKAFEQKKKDFQPLTERVKEILGGNIERVEVSNRMTTSPLLITTSRYGWTSRMQQIMQNQALSQDSMASHMTAKEILEVNPDHPIMVEMNKRFKADKKDEVCTNLAKMCYQTARLTSGGLTLKDPVEYAAGIFKLVKLGLSLEDNEEDQEMPKLEPVEGEKKGEENKMEEVD